MKGLQLLGRKKNSSFTLAIWDDCCRYCLYTKWLMKNKKVLLLYISLDITMINRKRLALTLGILSLVVHFVWIVWVALIPQAMQSILDWLTQIGWIQPVFVIQPVTWIQAIALVVLSFVCAYIAGFVLAALFNELAKRKK